MEIYQHELNGQAGIPEGHDDSDFVRQALANYLEDVSLPAYTPFHLLIPSEQSIVLRRAQTLKTASRE